MRPKRLAAAALAASLAMVVLPMSPVRALAQAGGKAVGHIAEHGQPVHYDTSAPLGSIAPAPKVRQHKHKDSPMPKPSGPVVSDPVVQPSATSAASSTASGSFPGIGADGSAPSDANLAVGPNDFVDMVNARIEIYAKDGTSILGPEPTNTVWSGFGGGCQNDNDGDGIVRYDALADRWVISQFALGPSGLGPFLQCVAVSATADPTGVYYRYSFAFSNFPDYPKLAVWPDGYYETMNMFSASGAFLGANTCAYDRAQMLDGLAAGYQCFNTTTTYGAILPADLDGTNPPPAGAPDMQIGLGTDNTDLASFAFHVDWTPGYSGTTLTEADVPVAAYSGACGGGGVCIPQLGTTQLLDSLADRMMYRFAYRNFGDHESWVVTYSVDVNGVSEPRWFELRRTPPATSGPLVVYQDSTYAPDSNDRWMGSMAMDQSGDMALGYSESSATMYPAIAYTGRLASDPLNTMEAETVLASGGGSQTGGLNRWGDYSAMTVDPSDGCTFWYTNQYLPASGSFNWATQINSFAFPSCAPRTDSEFSMATYPVSGLAAPSGSVSTTVSTDRTAGTAQDITLSASGLPAGVTATFSPQSVIAGPGSASSSTLTLDVSAGTAPGTYPVTITGTGASTATTTSFTLTVPAVPDFQLSAAPLTESVTAGSAASYTTTIGAVNGFTGAVDLSLSGLPVGATGSFNPALISGAGSSVLNVSTTSAVAPGTYLLTITGTSGTVVHSETVALVVNPAPVPDFALSATPGSQAVVAGSGTSYAVDVSGLNGFSGSVALSVSGLPTGVSGSFTSPNITGSGASTLSVTTAASAPAGTYPLTITGIAGSLSHSTTVDLTINPVPDFTVSVTPSSQSVRKGGTVGFTVAVTPENNFSGTVSLALASLPGGPSGTFTPSTLTSGTSALTVNAGNKAGTYTLTITASSGSTIHTATATLTVTTH